MRKKDDEEDNKTGQKEKSKKAKKQRRKKGERKKIEIDSQKSVYILVYTYARKTKRKLPN